MREPRGARANLTHVVALPLTILLTSFLISCGHSAGGPGTSRPAPPSAARVSLDRIYRDIDSSSPPKGVSADKWSLLTAELKRLIAARADAELRTGIGDGKTISVAPSGALNAVTDLRASSNASGTQSTLTWTEVLPGNCNNDGQVDIADLQPIAEHYGQSSSGPGSPAYLADANGDGQVGITDLQPIAANYGSHLQGYQVFRGNHASGLNTTWESTYRPNTGEPSNTNWSADRASPPPANSHPSYTYTDDISALTDKDHVRYKVIAFGDGSPGATSPEALMTPPTYFSVTGVVTNSLGGGGVAGVTLTLTPGGATATTAAHGTYSIYSILNGTYTLTPSMPGWTFAPVSSDVTVADADVSGMDFVGTLHSYSVSGSVTNAADPVPGVKLTLSPGGLTATTDSFGTYAISGVIDGSYTLAPSKGGYVFTPPNRSVEVAGANVTGQSFDGVAGLANSAWPKFRQNPANTGQSPYNGPATTPTVKWTFTTGAEVDSSPSIAEDGTIYVGSNDSYVYAVNPDGTLKWKRAALAPVASSPAVSRDGTIYIGSNAPDDSLYALNPADGSVRWKFTIASEVSSSPAISDDGIVYIGGTDKNVYALNPSDGSVIWQFATGNTVTSSPAIGPDGTIYVGSQDSYVYALNPLDGTPKWSYLTDGGVNFAPAVTADGIYVDAEAWNGSIFAVNLADGTLKWNRFIVIQGNVSEAAAVGLDGCIYVDGLRFGSQFYALNPSDGSTKWQVNLPGGATAAAVGADGTIYIGAGSAMYALSPTDGTTKWTFSLPNLTHSSPAIAVDGTLFLGCTDGNLYALDQ